MLTLNNGRQMPQLGIGTFSGFEDNKPMTTTEAVIMAFQEGYRHIDCAYAYNNEADIGVALKHALLQLQIKRYHIDSKQSA